MSKRGSDRKFPIEFSRGRRCQTIRCRCGQVGENPLGDNPAAGDALVAGVFRTLGWEVDARYRPDRHLCPKCVALERERKRIHQAEKRLALTAPDKPAASAVSLAKPEPRADLVTAKLDATMLLGDHYDVHAKNYRNGYSDGRVAQESRTPVEWVRKRREDDFGPLPPPAPKVAIEALGKVEAILRANEARRDEIGHLKGALANLIGAAARDIEALEALRRFLAEPAAKESIQ